MTDKQISHDDDILKTDEGLIFNPYNPINTEISLSQVQSILTKYGIPPVVNNIALYKRAFVHRSYTKRPHLENIQQNITIVERPPDWLLKETEEPPTPNDVSVSLTLSRTLLIYFAVRLIVQLFLLLFLFFSPSPSTLELLITGALKNKHSFFTSFFLNKLFNLV